MSSKPKRAKESGQAKGHDKKGKRSPNKPSKKEG